MISCANAMGSAIPTAMALVSLGFPVMKVARKERRWIGSLNTSSKRCVSVLWLWVEITQKAPSLWEEGDELCAEESLLLLAGISVFVFNYWLIMNLPYLKGECHFATANNASCIGWMYCTKLFFLFSFWVAGWKHFGSSSVMTFYLQLLINKNAIKGNHK